MVALFKSKSRLEAENAALRQQLTVLRRKVRGRVRLTSGDRLFFVQLYRWFPSILKVITIVRPETLVRWHRAGFRRYWSWKSRSLGGRPPIGMELRALIRRMSQENPLWGAPRIHGELLKLGFAVAQSTVAKYMARRSTIRPVRVGLPSCATMHQIAAMDLFVVPTIGFNLLYALIIVRLARRELVWVNVTAHPTAEWIARQITEAFPWNEAPRYLIRDRDGSMASLSGAGCRRWVSVTSRFPLGRHGRTVLPKGSLARSAASALTTSWYSANGTCGESCALTRCIIMKCEHIVPYRRMRLCRVLFSQSGASYLMRWSAGCTTNTLESELSVHTAKAAIDLERHSAILQKAEPALAIHLTHQDDQKRRRMDRPPR